MNFSYQSDKEFSVQADEMFDDLISQLSSGTARIVKPKNSEANRKMQTRMHFHNEPELSIILAGQLIFRTPVETFHLSAGDICLIPAGVPHIEEIVDPEDFLGFVVTEQAGLITMHFAQAVGNFLQPQNIGSHNFTLDRSLGEYINQAMKWLDDSKLAIGAVYSLQTYFHACREVISKHHEKGINYAPKVSLCIELARDYITDSTLTVAKLANWLNCNSDYLSNLFHRETGQRLKEWIAAQRILLARELLEDTAMSVAEIATNCGFNTSAYMRKVFKDKTGWSPSGYRKYYFKTAVPPNNRNQGTTA